VQRRLGYPPTTEGIFLVAFTFLCGYYTLYGAADFLASYGHGDADRLILLPVLRISTILAVALLAPRFYRWQGRAAAGYLGLCGALTLLTALASWVSAVNFGGVGAVLSVIAFLAAGVLFARSFPRALRS
jgi:hypothetical protein